MPKKFPNSYATKADLKKLEIRIDKRFEQVDKRFEQMDDRFRWFRMEIKDDLELWKKDTFREFEHRWQLLIDPVLKELKDSREERTILFQQYQRHQVLLEKIAEKIQSHDVLLGKIAKKVGVK